MSVRTGATQTKVSRVQSAYVRSGPRIQTAQILHRRQIDAPFFKQVRFPSSKVATKSHRVPRDMRVTSYDFNRTQPSRLDSAKMTNEVTLYRNNKLIENQNLGYFKKTQHYMSREQKLLLNYNKDSTEILNQISGEGELAKPGNLKKRPLSFSNFHMKVPTSETN